MRWPSTRFCPCSVGTGRYDDGHFFEGALYLMNLEATLAGTQAECWLPSGVRKWTVPAAPMAYRPSHPSVAGHPCAPAQREFRRLFPYSWEEGETHLAGPGVETADNSLVCAGTVYQGHGLQPGDSFVVRRELTSGHARWVFRTDRKASDLDADAETAYVAYDDGEIVALDLSAGTVRWRRHLTIADVPAVPTALTVTGLGGAADLPPQRRGHIHRCRLGPQRGLVPPPGLPASDAGRL